MVMMTISSAQTQRRRELEGPLDRLEYRRKSVHVQILVTGIQQPPSVVRMTEPGQRRHWRPQPSYKSLSANGPCVACSRDPSSCPRPSRSSPKKRQSQSELACTEKAGVPTTAISPSNSIMTVHLHPPLEKGGLLWLPDNLPRHALHLVRSIPSLSHTQLRFSLQFCYVRCRGERRGEADDTSDVSVLPCC